MSTIKISDLCPTGSELFSDSESYMSELGDSELNIINGGAFTTPACAAAVLWALRSSRACARTVIAASRVVAHTLNV